MLSKLLPIWALLSFIEMTHGLRMELSSSTLPYGGGSLMTSHYDGKDSIYIFGGYDNLGYHTSILVYSISTESISLLTRVPTGLNAGVLMADADGNMFHAGGGNKEDSILRISPSNGTAQRVQYLERAIFLGTSAQINSTTWYIYGNGRGFVQYFDTSSNETGFVEPGLPYNSAFAHGVTTIFNQSTNEVLAFIHQDFERTFVYRHNVLDGSSELLPSIFPRITGATYPQGVWDGKRYLYIMPGLNYDPMDSLIRYDPIQHKIVYLELENHPGGGLIPFSSTSVTYVDQLNRLYMFGGNLGEQYMHNIWYIDLNETNPLAVHVLDVEENEDPSVFEIQGCQDYNEQQTFHCDGFNDTIIPPNQYKNATGFWTTCGSSSCSFLYKRNNQTADAIAIHSIQIEAYHYGPNAEMRILTGDLPPLVMRGTDTWATYILDATVYPNIAGLKMIDIGLQIHNDAMVVVDKIKVYYKEVE